jgi:hypothetical protein
MARMNVVGVKNGFRMSFFKIVILRGCALLIFLIFGPGGCGPGFEIKR